MIKEVPGLIKTVRLIQPGTEMKSSYTIYWITRKDVNI